MLAPETRLLLTDALRPPAGYAVDLAVGTTYSLDLIALLMAPMTFALHEDDLSDLTKVDPIKLLEAVRRHADHTTVFVQAGAIAVPSSYQRVLTFTEDSVQEVTAPNPGRLFHPKTWTLRFTDRAGERLHRLVVLSRNLTFDRSWDTVMVLDEPEPTTESATLDAGPLARFLSHLPGRAVRRLSPDRDAQVRSLVESLAGVRLELPEHFDEGHLLPLGFDWSDSVDVPSGSKSLCVSPFLDTTTIKKLIQRSQTCTVLSRPETLDRLGAHAFGDATTYVLQRAAEREVDADHDDPAVVSSERSVPEGLHAKTFVFETGSRTTVVSGSANATGAGFTGNVEFDVVLSGPTKHVGIASFWEGSGDAPGFLRMCQPHSPSDEPVGEATDEETIWTIERFHAALAEGGLHAVVEPATDDRWDLSLALPEVDSPGTTTVRPVSLPDAGWRRRVDEDDLRWSPISLNAITPLFVVTTVAGAGDARAEVSAVLTADLSGDPPERRRDALASYLKSSEDVLRYLAFLLDGIDLLGGGSGAEGVNGFFGAGSPGSRTDLVLFEPLVKALAAGSDALARIAALHDDISSLPQAGELLPTGWTELWSAVWSAHQQMEAPR